MRRGEAEHQRWQSEIIGAVGEGREQLDIQIQEGLRELHECRETAEEVARQATQQLLQVGVERARSNTPHGTAIHVANMEERMGSCHIQPPGGFQIYHGADRSDMNNPSTFESIPAVRPTTVRNSDGEQFTGIRGGLA